MQTVIDRAVESYRRQWFLESLNSDFAALRSEPDEWDQEQKEREFWEQTLADELDQE